MTMSFLRWPETCDCARALFVVVLDAFLRGEDRVAPAGHHRLNILWLRSERRRHLGGLEDAQASARAGTHEDDPSALAERRRDHLHADGDAFALAPHGFEHLAVFVEHQVDDVVGGELVDPETDGVDGFGGQRLPL